MDYKTYVQNVVASYIEKKDRNVIFIKHYNTLSISRDEILASVTQTEDEVFLYHEYKAADMHEAYAPFLDWIRTCYDLYYKDKMTAEAQNALLKILEEPPQNVRNCRHGAFAFFEGYSCQCHRNFGQCAIRIAAKTQRR